MKRILTKTVALIFCLMLTAAVFSSCSSKNDRIDFIYPFSGSINSFDPQVAATQDEFLVVENCFEGLIRINDKGETTAGVAENWNINSDGTVYTFNLKKGVNWRFKEEGSAETLIGKEFNPEITANDFVFALRRVADPNTACPMFSSFSGIKNATAIQKGKLSPDKLGVYAKDKYTLVIQLENADDGFMTALTTAAAMPCNEEFFNASKGRYGLGTEYSLFNGQFYVSSILESSYILRKNDLYTGPSPSQVTDITLKITDSESDIPKNLKNGYYDCAYISGSEYEALDSDKISVTPYSDKTWAFLLNKNRQIFSNKILRQAMCLSVSRPVTENHPYLTEATGIIPPSCLIGGKAANEAVGTTKYSNDPEKAVELWRKGLAEERFTSADITVIVPEEMEEEAKQLVQGIQGSIGKISSYGDNGTISFSLKILPLNQEDYKTAFNSGEYDLALYCFAAESTDSVAFLQGIVSGNFIGQVSSVDNAVSKAQTASASLSDACRSAEEAILDDYSLIPLFYESSYYTMAKGVSGVDFHAGSGRVSFINAKRDN